MSPAETPARQTKIRIKTFCKGIESGDYDNDLEAIQESLDTRGAIRRHSVDQLVLEVYGTDFSVQPVKQAPTFFRDNPENQLRDTPENELFPEEPGAGHVVDSNHVILGGQKPQDDADRERMMEADIENHGSVIGGLDPSTTVN